MNLYDGPQINVRILETKTKTKTRTMYLRILLTSELLCGKKWNKKLVSIKSKVLFTITGEWLCEFACYLVHVLFLWGYMSPSNLVDLWPGPKDGLIWCYFSIVIHFINQPYHHHLLCLDFCFCCCSTGWLGMQSYWKIVHHGNVAVYNIIRVAFFVHSVEPSAWYPNSASNISHPRAI